MFDTHWYVRFHNLEMNGPVTLAFANDRPRFYLVMTQDVSISSESTFDFSRNDKVQINSTEDATRFLLGNILFRHSLIVSSSDVELDGLMTVSQSIVQEVEYVASYIMLNSDKLYLHSNAKIEAGFVFLQANETIKSDAGASITSLKQNTCNEAATESDPFTCVPFHSLDGAITPESFLANFNTKFGSNVD